jgi:uncharacterized RDD family membrane protein YckC
VLPYDAPRDPTAVIGRRVGAWAIDAAVIAVPPLALAASDLEYLTEDRLADDGIDIDDFCEELSEQDSSYVCGVVGDRAYFDESLSAGPGFLWLGLALLILVLMQGLTGATVGKAMTGLRAVGEDGRRPGIGKAFLRTLMWVVDAAPWCLPLVGFITGLTTTGHRRVGDMAAKTFVVRASDAGAPIVVPGMTPSTPVDVGPGYATAPPWEPSVPSHSSQPWQPPAPEPTPAPQAAQPAQPAHQPQWDAARGTYITWDPARRAWLQWDERSSTWVPIST